MHCSLKRGVQNGGPPAKMRRLHTENRPQNKVFSRTFLLLPTSEPGTHAFSFALSSPGVSYTLQTYLTPENSYFESLMVDDTTANSIPMPSTLKRVNSLLAKLKKRGFLGASEDEKLPTYLTPENSSGESPLVDGTTGNSIPMSSTLKRVNILLAKLKESGFLESSEDEQVVTEGSSEEVREASSEGAAEPSVPKMSSFKIRNLRVRCASVVNALHQGFRTCPLCGKPIAPNLLDDHMIWHIHQPLSATTKTPTRGWYGSAQEWINHVDKNDEEESDLKKLQTAAKKFD